MDYLKQSLLLNLENQSHTKSALLQMQSVLLLDLEPLMKQLT
jgi:hypothetical protein